MRYKLWTKKHQKALIKLRKAYHECDKKALIKDCILCESINQDCDKCSWCYVDGLKDKLEERCVYYYHNFNRTGNILLANIVKARQSCDPTWIAHRVPMLDKLIKKWDDANGI